MNFEYRIERERGLDFEEDLYQPFTLRFQLTRRSAAAVIASTQPHDAKSAAVLREARTPPPRSRCRRRARRPAAGEDAGRRRRSVHRPARIVQIHRRRLSLVHRLGPRHHDRAARPDAGHRTLRHRPPDPRSLRRKRRPGHAPQSFPGRRRDSRIQYRRRHAVVLRSHPRLPPLQRRRRLRAPAALSQTERHHRLARARHPLRHSCRCRWSAGLRRTAGFN